MTILNFILDHLGLILILAGLSIVALVLWALWDDESRVEDKLNTKLFNPPPQPFLKSSRFRPRHHDAPYQTPFQAHTQAEIKGKTKPHPKPRKH